MSGQKDDHILEPWMQVPLIRELEAALIEYVERYGLTDRARAVLTEIGKAASLEGGEQGK